METAIKRIGGFLNKPIGIYPLVTFRILFGGVMLFSIIRFWYLGWIERQYIDSIFQFKYYGFDWVQPFSAPIMYGIYGLLALACVFIMLGFLYRISIIYFFVAFSYCELIDLTYYLNHYYFISLVAFIMIWLPANRYLALDTHIFRGIKTTIIQRWHIDVIKLQLGIVYFYAGLAKLNYEWLFNAQPLKIWLPANNNLPVIGQLLNYEWTAYAFSWGGALYDLSIPFLLLYHKTRPFAFVAVLGFHIITGAMFQIGMFPYIMILSTLIFFSNNWHKNVLLFARRLFRKGQTVAELECMPNMRYKKTRAAILIVFLLFQLIFPFRYLLYPGNVFWTEEGYRFSWRVMLMEKAGTATFYVKDGMEGREGVVVNRDFLNDHQEKQMSMQPDMILQFAHFLEDYYLQQGFKDPFVRVESYVTYNARPSKLLIDPNLDLTKVQDSWKHKDWVLPF